MPPSPCVCSTLRRAARSVTARYDRALSAAGLTVTQYAILARIHRAKAVALTELAANMGMDRTTLHRDLLPLERAGWVRSAEGEDRRQRLLELTPAGKARHKAARPAWAAAQRETLARLGEERWQQLREILLSL
jgi:DNA-binding MarR family transcriptional regulator